MPTQKQKTLAREILQNPTQTMGKAMEKAGYDPTTRPIEVTESKGWQELMEKYLPDDDLLEVHSQGLKATKIHTSHTEPDREVADHQTRAKYLELGYRVKGRLQSNTIQMNVGQLIQEQKNKYGI